MQLQDEGLLHTSAYFDGGWHEADDGATTPVLNPATGETLAQVSRCGQAETRRAIAAAHRAFLDWRQRTAEERAAALGRLNDLIMANLEDLSRILTIEQGKPLAEARKEVEIGAGYIKWFAEEARRVYGDTIPSPRKDHRLLAIKQPVGVAACITPWNFPNAMLARKLGPALASGCTVVCKPANATPLSALALAELSARAEIPAGVVNVLCGDTQAIGAELTSNPRVRKLTFTGSTEVGKLLLEQCAATVKRTSMELGGNAPFIVFDDADLDAAVQGALACKYRNAGQTCVCANRIFVQSGIYRDFAERFAAASAGQQIGNGLDEDTVIGPLIDRQAADSVLEMIEDAMTLGAEVVTGGKRAGNGECFVEPTVLTAVKPEMRVFREEIFGPVAPLFEFDTEEEAIALANDTNAGLAAYFYARDVGRIWRVAEALDYGIVGINEGIVTNPMSPFGGMKESGSGREGSKYGMDDYLEIKYLCMGGL